MIAIGVLGLIGLAAILVVCIVGLGAIAHNTNATDDQLKKIRKQLDELISRQYEWHEEWRAKP